MARGGIKVRGLKETARAFDDISDDLSEELREGLKDAAEPVRVAAENHAIRRISGLAHGDDWAKQKIVVSKRTALVFMAPQKRGTRLTHLKRKNFGTLLMERAMEPALGENERRVEEKVDDVLNRLSFREGF